MLTLQSYNTHTHKTLHTHMYTHNTYNTQIIRVMHTTHTAQKTHNTLLYIHHIACYTLVHNCSDVSVFVSEYENNIIHMHIKHTETYTQHNILDMKQVHITNILYTHDKAHTLEHTSSVSSSSSTVGSF